MNILAIVLGISGAFADPAVQTDANKKPDQESIVIETDDAGKPAIEIEASQPKKKRGSSTGQAPEQSTSEVRMENAPQMGVQFKFPLSKPKNTSKPKPTEAN